jgi:hypothetical protein
MRRGTGPVNLRACLYQGLSLREAAAVVAWFTSRATPVMPPVCQSATFLSGEGRLPVGKATEEERVTKQCIIG